MTIKFFHLHFHFLQSSIFVSLTRQKSWSWLMQVWTSAKLVPKLEAYDGLVPMPVLLQLRVKKKAWGKSRIGTLLLHKMTQARPWERRISEWRKKDGPHKLFVHVVHYRFSLMSSVRYDIFQRKKKDRRVWGGKSYREPCLIIVFLVI